MSRRKFFSISTSIRESTLDLFGRASCSDFSLSFSSKSTNLTDLKRPCKCGISRNTWSPLNSFKCLTTRVWSSIKARTIQTATLLPPRHACFFFKIFQTRMRCQLSKSHVPLLRSTRDTFAYSLAILRPKILALRPRLFGAAQNLKSYPKRQLHT